MAWKAQQQVCARVVLRNLPHQPPEVGADIGQVLRVDEICTADRSDVGDTFNSY